MAYRIVHAEVGCVVELEADIALQGPIAQIGRQGLIDEVASRLIDDFVACVETALNAPSGQEPSSIAARKIGAVGLLVASMWAVTMRFFKRLGRHGDVGP